MNNIFNDIFQKYGAPNTKQIYKISFIVLNY